MSTRSILYAGFACLLATGATGCGKPTPPVVKLPNEPATIRPSANARDLAKWVGTWECTHNNLFGSAYIRIEFTKEGDRLLGALVTSEGETIRCFPLSEIEANGETFQFSWQYPTGSIIIGDLADQIVDRLLDRTKEYPKRLSRLVLTGTDTATERMFHQGSWNGFQGDYPIFSKRK